MTRLDVVSRSGEAPSALAPSCGAAGRRPRDGGAVPVHVRRSRLPRRRASRQHLRLAEALAAGRARGAREASDRRRAQALALTEEEFRDHVWPELPTSRPERNVPFELRLGPD